MIGHSEVCEDFTFPTVSDHNSICHFHSPQFSTSPFWFVSKTLPERAELGPEPRRRRSFSAAEGNRIRFDGAPQMRVNSTLSDHAVGPRILDAEEKMDMLWEDLNEELCGETAQKISSSSAGRPDFSLIPESDKAHIGDLSRVKALKFSKKGSLVAHCRPTLLVVLKVVKKLLLIHSSGYHKKV